MNKELEEAIEKIKYGIKELKDSYELYNKSWAENLLKVMSDSLENITNYLKNSIPKQVLEERLESTQSKYIETVYEAIKLEIKKSVLKELMEEN